MCQITVNTRNCINMNKIYMKLVQQSEWKNMYIKLFEGKQIFREKKKKKSS